MGYPTDRYIAQELNDLRHPMQRVTDALLEYCRHTKDIEQELKPFLDVVAETLANAVIKDMNKEKAE